MEHMGDLKISVNLVAEKSKIPSFPAFLAISLYYTLVVENSKFLSIPAFLEIIRGLLSYQHLLVY